MIKYPRIKRTAKVKRGNTPVTVCIAAIYNKGSIIGVSDRMITAGIIEYESPQTNKTLPLTSSVVAMVAGDLNVQTLLHYRIKEVVDERVARNPSDWIPVADVAALYRDTYMKMRTEAAERAVLAPQGLTFATFLSEQVGRDESFTETLRNQLECFVFPDVETIIAGIDSSGAHLYTVENGSLSCNDMAGFSAVGSGYWHAQSHFMQSRYSTSDSEARALFNIHLAKKKAEVSPGVGKETDMFVMGPGLGTFQPLTSTPALDIVGDVDKLYNRNYSKQIDKVIKSAETQVAAYLDRLPKTGSGGPQASPSPTPPEDNK